MTSLKSMKRAVKAAARSNLLYVFLAWNAVGWGIYKWCQVKFANEPDWSELNSSQRYLKMMGKTDEPLTEIRVSGLNFANYQKRETTFEEIAKPESK